MTREYARVGRIAPAAVSDDGRSVGSRGSFANQMLRSELVWRLMRSTQRLDDVALVGGESKETGADSVAALIVVGRLTPHFDIDHKSVTPDSEAESASLSNHVRQSRCQKRPTRTDVDDADRLRTESGISKLQVRPQCSQDVEASMFAAVGSRCRHGRVEGGLELALKSCSVLASNGVDTCSCGKSHEVALLPWV